MDTPTTYDDLRSVKTKATDASDDLKAKAQDIAEDARAEIAALRERVETLMSERVTPALSQAADRAEATVNNARVQLRDGSQALSERVREQPLLAVGLAALAGFLLAALFRR